MDYFQKVLENSAFSPLFTVCWLCDVQTKHDTKLSGVDTSSLLFPLGQQHAL